MTWRRFIVLVNGLRPTSAFGRSVRDHDTPHLAGSNNTTVTVVDDF